MPVRWIRCDLKLDTEICRSCIKRNEERGESAGERRNCRSSHYLIELNLQESPFLGLRRAQFIDRLGIPLAYMRKKKRSEGRRARKWEKANESGDV
ncbi:unnamed protein product [Microthlaspi erraticum]|uniref:Uncharacterized protein n=1 Tax=Microthlaspi erraticum TaxID=1685480 RepID=A0A6D2HWG7_9BRAS|nr:unnamed protein product [Microthlaspi erraticum]